MRIKQTSNGNISYHAPSCSHVTIDGLIYPKGPIRIKVPKTEKIKIKKRRFEYLVLGYTFNNFDRQSNQRYIQTNFHSDY